MVRGQSHKPGYMGHFWVDMGHAKPLQARCKRHVKFDAIAAW